MAAIDSWLESFLPDLLRSRNTRIRVPTVSPSLANVGTMIAIDVGRREPSRTAAFVHIDAVMIVSEFERITVFLRVGSYSCSVFLHRLADARQRHLNGLEEAWIISRPIAVVRIDNDGFFRLRKRCDASRVVAPLHGTPRRRPIVSRWKCPFEIESRSDAGVPRQFVHRHRVVGL